MSTGGEPTVRVAGERLVLLPERAAFWVESRTLLIADVHFGKAASFRAGGLPVPAGTTAESLRRINGALARVPAQRIAFLGDFLHARQGRAPRTLERLRLWREEHRELEILLVRGNHDRAAGDPPDELGIRCVNEPWLEAGLALVHHPRAVPGAYAIGGHIHPAVRLVGRGRQRKRLPCFWFGPGVAVLPAFGEFTGAAMIEPASADQVFVVAGDEVVPVGV